MPGKNAGIWSTNTNFRIWKREMVDYFEQVSKEKEIEPKVSVIVPVDIEAEYLEDMLRSLLDQTLKEA